MTDNLDVFERIIFRIPSFERTLAGIVILGFVYSALSWLSISLFAPVNLNPLLALLMGSSVFIFPSLVSGELLHHFLPDYPRKWGYFLAASNQLILFVFTLILSGANNLGNAWSIFWIALVTVYLSNLLVLVLTLGRSHLLRIVLLSSIQPFSVFVVFYAIVGSVMQIPIYLYIRSFGFVFVAGLALLASFLIFEYLLQANVSNISALNLISGLLQKRQEALDLGYPTEVDVQTLRVQNESSALDLAVPWVHPGPLEGFGGGELTTRIIDGLNQDGREGFFLHVPSTHKSDPASPESAEKILESVKSPKTASNASKLVEKSYNGLKLYGRKVDGKKIVYIDPRGFGSFDDYELSIFREVIDPEEVVLVDLHSHPKDADMETVWYNTETASFLRESLEDFLEELEEKEVEDYSAGFSVDIGDTSNLALVEEVGDQRTLLFGIEGNDLGPELAELEREYSREFDEVLVFTTDTHRSIHELSDDKQVEKETVQRNVDEADGNVSSASLGFGSQKTSSMRLLQEDYHGLIFSINILVRLIPLTLILFYLALIIWIW
jgi:putative membrane protein